MNSTIAIAVIIVLAVLLLIALYGIRRLAATIKQMREQAKERTKRAVTSSRSSLTGKIFEQVAALLPGFAYNPRNVQWVGGTVDAVIWDGLEEGHDVTVVFLDVKTGGARLSQNQRKIREAVQAGRVRFDSYTCPTPEPEQELLYATNPD